MDDDRRGHAEGGKRTGEEMITKERDYIMVR